MRKNESKFVDDAEELLSLPPPVAHNVLPDERAVVESLLRPQRILCVCAYDNNMVMRSLLEHEP